MTFARPFLKWTGGKMALVPELLKHLPSTFGTYHEPFLGGGALFFLLQPQRAVLSDVNLRLIRTYRAVKDHVENVIPILRDEYTPRHSKEFYYAMRNLDADHYGDVGVAVWFLYLNKTCFNGLWRVNKSNKFNVPAGDYKNPTIYNEANLRACSKALASTEIHHSDFRACEVRAQPGDVVYFDPPYVPLTATSDFTNYTAEGFSPKDQIDLRDLALRLKQRGVHVILSNSSAPAVRQLYGDPFTIHEVDVRRAINSDVEKRGAVKEFIIT